MSKKANHEFVNEIENELRDIEKRLEAVGRKVCDIENGCMTWNDINRSLNDLSEAIHSAWRMRPTDSLPF